MQIFETIDSTQIEAKRQIDVKGFIVEDLIITKEQTAGVSTKKNFPWDTKKGDLNFTAIFNIKELQKRGHVKLNWLPFCSGLAVLENIKLVAPDLKCFLKWPNDLLVLQNTTNEFRKLNGTLAEVYKDHFIIGVGANLLHYPECTEHFKATSIKNETGLELDCIDFGIKVFTTFKKNIEKLQLYGFDPIKTQWKKNAYMLGTKLLLRDHNVVIFEDITDEGYILAKTNEGNDQIIISSDEVILKSKK